jgi:hypothetical protein
LLLPHASRVYLIQMLECPVGQQIGQRLISITMGAKGHCEQSRSVRS